MDAEGEICFMRTELGKGVSKLDCLQDNGREGRVEMRGESRG